MPHRHSTLFATLLLAGAMHATANTEQTETHMSYCGHEEHDSMSLRHEAAKRISWKMRDFDKSRDVSFKILGFNDFHGAIEQRSLFGRPVGGAAVLASYFAAEAAESDNGAIIVHAGDQVGATPPVSALLQDEPAIQFLNMVSNEYCKTYFTLHPKCNVIGTLGNHEFDEGIDEMLRLIKGGNHANGPFLDENYKGADFPYVSANVVYADSGRYVLPPFVIKRIGGVKVGFIGAVLKETPTIVTPIGVAGVEFLDEAESINKLVPVLKFLGVRSIVVTIHQGTRQASFSGPTSEEPQELGSAIGDIVSKLDDEIDIVVSGHAHGFTNQLVENQNGKAILVTQAYSSGTAYADIDVTVDRFTGDVVAKSSEILTTWADEGPGLTPNEGIAEMVAAAAERVQPLVERVIGTAANAITRTENTAGESALGNLIADAQRASTGTDVSFMNPGGIRADLEAGETTWGELFTIQPFGNDLTTMELTGAQIIALLNQQWSGGNESSPRILKTSGIEYTWDASLPANERVVNASIGGVAVGMDSVYSVTVNSFIAAGGDNFTVLTEGTNRVIGQVDLDALVDYIQSLTQPFTAEVEGRIQRLN